MKTSLAFALVASLWWSIFASTTIGRSLAADKASDARTRVSLIDGRWHVNERPSNPGSQAEGLLLNVRMANAVFEDRNKTDFDSDQNTRRFLTSLPEYAAAGVNAFTISLQGGYPGYEGARNSAFAHDGSLQLAYLERVDRVIRACDHAGIVVILSCFYQRQDQTLDDAEALRRASRNVADWIRAAGYTNVVLEIANEFGHAGFDHALLKSGEGQAELIRLVKGTHPALLVSTSSLGDARFADEPAKAADFLLIHLNTTRIEDYGRRIDSLKRYGKPIVCNEDIKLGDQGVQALRRCVQHGASWGLMVENVNQRFPFRFDGVADDPRVYEEMRRLTTTKTANDYFPPPESQGGWRKLESANELHQLAGMDERKLSALREWLLNSDRRDFAAVVVRNGYVVLEVERGNSSKTDTRRVASVSKAICATVLAIASEQSRQGKTPHKMSFGDPAFDYLPWAQPLSDPRKKRITVKQLLNHTSGICPEAIGAPNDGKWEYVLGRNADPRTAMLAFDPGEACGYSTHAFAHAALVCENVTGRPYEQFAVDEFFRPLGCEKWWFQYYEGESDIGRHASHGVGMPVRDLARIGYCMLKEGRWGNRQVVPRWFVEETSKATHDVTSPERRWQLNPQIFSHGWELPALLDGSGPDRRNGQGIPADTRSKPGSGGQILAFVPSLQLVIARQTGGSGSWEYEEFLRRSCAAVVNSTAP